MMLDLYRPADVAMGHLERKEVLEACAVQAKKWRRSLRSMDRDGRTDEATRLRARLQSLNAAREKLGAMLDEVTVS